VCVSGCTLSIPGAVHIGLCLVMSTKAVKRKNIIADDYRGRWSSYSNEESIVLDLLVISRIMNTDNNEQ